MAVTRPLLSNLRLDCTVLTACKVLQRRAGTPFETATHANELDGELLCPNRIAMVSVPDVSSKQPHNVRPCSKCRDNFQDEKLGL